MSGHFRFGWGCGAPQVPHNTAGPPAGVGGRKAARVKTLLRRARGPRPGSHEPGGPLRRCRASELKHTQCERWSFAPPRPVQSPPITHWYRQPSSPHHRCLSTTSVGTTANSPPGDGPRPHPKVWKGYSLLGRPAPEESHMKPLADIRVIELSNRHCWCIQRQALCRCRC